MKYLKYFLSIFLLLLCSCSKNIEYSIIENNKLEFIPDMFSYGKSDIEGQYLAEINTVASSYIIRFDNRGNIIDNKKISDMGTDFIGRISNFSKAVNDDLYYYFRTSYFDFETIGSELILTDNSFNEIGKIQYLKDGDIYPVDDHDAIVFDEDNYIIASEIMEYVNNSPDDHHEAKVCYIQEVEDSQIKWQFRSADYPELYNYTMHHMNEYDHFPDDYSDYMHFNSFAIDPVDNNLLVSFRNQCSIIKINRNNGQIMWILGGKGDQFGIGDSLYACQHSISFTDEGNLLMYNNNYESIDSSILEIKIDETNKSIKVVNKLNLPVDTINYGTVEKISKDTYLIHYGIHTDLDIKNGFYEVDSRNGRLKYSIIFDDLIENNFIHHISFD